MEIKGISNTTLIDFPGLVAATVFTGGCDFSCPFCYNRSLVVNPDRLPSLSLDDVYTLLRQRRVALEGVCITGGEPLLQKDLMTFMSNLKEMDYKIKLDTNGYDPTHLSHILKEDLVDYIAMDIKNSQENYGKTAGKSPFDLTRIKLSVDLIRDSGIDYEFRTTLVRELHTPEDIEHIGQWLSGAKAYYISPYIENGDVIMPIFSSYSKAEMLQFQKLLSYYIPYVGIRGYES